jgi:hypothetical protein
VGRSVHCACVDGEYVKYFRYDGSSWTKPIEIKQSRNTTNLATRARLAVESDGTAHVAWWTAADGDRDIYGCAAVKNGNVQYEPMEFEGQPIDRDRFDLGISPDRELLLAHASRTRKSGKSMSTINVRNRKGEKWTKPEEIFASEDVEVHDLQLRWTQKRAVAIWGARGAQSNPINRISTTDGTKWTKPRELAKLENSKLGEMIVPGLALDSQGSLHALWAGGEVYYCLVCRIAR